MTVQRHVVVDLNINGGNVNLQNLARGNKLIQWNVTNMIVQKIRHHSACVVLKRLIVEFMEAKKF